MAFLLLQRTGHCLCIEPASNQVQIRGMEAQRRHKVSLYPDQRYYDIKLDLQPRFVHWPLSTTHNHQKQRWNFLSDPLEALALT